MLVCLTTKLREKGAASQFWVVSGQLQVERTQPLIRV